MPNYYEILCVAPSASEIEIQAAYDTQYNQWRRLVTHHNPNVVNQANQALQTLEKIKATLTDPSRRAAYNEGIGVAGPVGGLADPAALLRTLASPPAPTLPPANPAVTAPAVSNGLWTCYKCSTENSPQTKFCLKCAAQLVRTCPECRGETSLVATSVCGRCGYSYETANRRQEIRQQIPGIQRELADAQQKARNRYAHANFSKFSGTALSFGGIFIVFIIGSAAGDEARMVIIGIGLLMFLGGLLGLVQGVVLGKRAAQTALSEHDSRIVQLQESLRQLQVELDVTTRSS